MEICYKNQRNISDNGLGLAFSLEAGGLFLLYTTHDDQCKCPSYLCKVHKMRLFGNNSYYCYCLELFRWLSLY